jgi:hypothetical protein
MYTPSGVHVGETIVGSGAFHHGSASSIGSAGTSVATETWGQVSLAKFSDTFWVYWILGVVHGDRLRTVGAGG